MPSFPEEFDRTLLVLLTAAERLSADWMLIGGVAVASWGEPRATTDIDFALSVSIDLADAVDRTLVEHGCKRVGGPGQIKNTGLFLVQYEKPIGEGRCVGLDIFFTMTDWQRRALKRRREVTLRDRTFWVATPEDLILYKLIANRGIDQSDIDHLLDRRHDGLDLPYIAAWARTLDLESRWLDALSRLHDRRDLGL